jgi:hypothetical protein
VKTEPATQEDESSTVNIKAEPSETSLKPDESLETCSS